MKNEKSERAEVSNQVLEGSREHGQRKQILMDLTSRRRPGGQLSKRERDESRNDRINLGPVRAITGPAR